MILTMNNKNEFVDTDYHNIEEFKNITNWLCLLDWIRGSEHSGNSSVEKYLRMYGLGGGRDEELE